LARLLVQLKLRLLTNALRSSRAAKLSFIVSTTFALLLAIGTFLVLAGFRGKATSVELTAIIFTVFAFGWLIAPIMVFGVDSTLDPATLALYPLRTRRLATGLLAASATGAWPLANVIGLLGVTVGLASGALGVVVAVIAVALQVLFCIALSRFVTTSLAGLLRSRRGRDLAAFLIVPLVALYEFFTQVVPKEASAGKLRASSFTGLDSWMRWLPPGLAAHAIQDASDGRPGLAIARLSALAAVIVVLVWLWVSALNRALVTTDTTTQGARVRGTKLPLAGLGVRGAVAARTWLYQRRDPTSLVYWALVAVITAAVSASSILGKNHHPGVIVASAVFGAAFVGIFHANSAGQTGPPFFLEATALSRVRDLRAYFSGQNLALCLIGAPLVVAVCFGLGAAVGHPGLYGVEAAPVVLAGLGASLGLSNLFTAVLPYPMVKRPGTPMLVAAPGYAAYRLGSVFGTLAGTAVLAAPMIAAVELAQTGPLALRLGLLLPCGALYGFALAFAGVRLAAAAAAGKMPELFQVAISSPLS
jgi:ABC-2 type transport system permease protein